MGNRLNETQECARFYFSTRYIRLGMTNYTSRTWYCICLATILSMLKRLKSAIAVFVFEQSDFVFLCVSAIHAQRTICKDYVMNCPSILYSLWYQGSLLVLTINMINVIVKVRSWMQGPGDNQRYKALSARKLELIFLYFVW